MTNLVLRKRRSPPKNLPPAPGATQKSFTFNNLTWVDVIRPTRDIVESIGEHYSFHPLHIQDVLSRQQRPKLDDNEEEQYVFLVLHFPFFDETERLSVISEIDMFVGPDFVVTFHDGRLRPMRRLIQTAADERGIELLFSRGSGFLVYRIVDALVNYCFPMMYKLDEKLDGIEEQMFRRDVQSTVRDLSFLRRDIIALRRIMRPNLPVTRLLASREREYLRLDEDAYFGDLTDGLNRIWDMLEEQKEIIEGLDSTISSLTSHRINQEMKVFTLISVIMLPMTLVASVLGMNVIIPFSDSPFALPIILLVMILLAMVLLFYFRYKRML
ncbi:MAG: magnesium transporter CorA family protein [Oscillochloris sp.]|nr:magnesium transporter CorA family protein [Oscillochloris sp.]